jgi:hypothetical protein
MWRQGSIVSPQCLTLLGIEHKSTTRVVVISHSCDIASDAELDVELLIGETVADKKFANGHSIRNLDVSTDDDEIIRCLINARCTIAKNGLLTSDASTQCIKPNDLAILKRWLAQRYSRPEFPDAFIKRLRESGLENDLDKWSKRFSNLLTGVYVDLKPSTELKDPEQPYQFLVSLVYASDDTNNEKLAQDAQLQFREFFEARCKQGEHWKWVELANCETYSDLEFSLRDANTLKRWRFEHRSVAGEPVDRGD